MDFTLISKCTPCTRPSTVGMLAGVFGKSFQINPEISQSTSAGSWLVLKPGAPTTWSNDNVGYSYKIRFPESQQSALAAHIQTSGPAIRYFCYRKLGRWGKMLMGDNGISCNVSPVKVSCFCCQSLTQGKQGVLLNKSWCYYPSDLRPKGYCLFLCLFVCLSVCSARRVSPIRGFSPDREIVSRSGE